MALIDVLERIARRFDEIERRLEDPEVMARPSLLADLLKERGGLEPKALVHREYRRVERELNDAREMLRTLSDRDEVALFRDEIERLESALEEMNARVRETLAVDDGNAHRDVILEIRAGTGGDEAALFAGDLLRMYSHYAAEKGWTIEILDVAEGGVGGIREVVANITGEDVYHRLQFESGGHRVQRVPETESQGRVHTSAATVAVLPEASQAEVDIREQDLRIDTFRSSGPGGQSVNKTSSAIRVTHVPTGVVVSCQDEKSQHKNKAKALKILASRLYELEQRRIDEQRSSTRRALIGSGDRSERIRTYNFPQNRITDHRIGLSLYSLDRLMEGELDPLIDPLLEHDKELRLRSLDDEETKR